MKQKNKKWDRDTLTFIRLLYEKGYRGYYIENVSKKNKLYKSPYSLIAEIKKGSYYIDCSVWFCHGDELKIKDVSELKRYNEDKFNKTENVDNSVFCIHLRTDSEKIKYSRCSPSISTNKYYKEINSLYEEAKVFNLLDFFSY